MTNTTKSALAAAQRALDDAARNVAYLHETVKKSQGDDDAHHEAQVRELTGIASAFVMAAVTDVPVPLPFFKPWASAPVIKQWKREGHLPSLDMRNGKLTCLPSEFFKYFRGLKNDGGARGKNGR